MTESKTGKQFLEDFFSKISKIKGNENLDTEVVELLVQLFEEEKFTNTNITNGLNKLREKNNENKINNA